MAVARANSQFYGSAVTLPYVSSTLRRGLQSIKDAKWPLRPSALFIEALEAQGLSFFPQGDDDSSYWLSWNQQLGGKRAVFGGDTKERHLLDTTPGAGMANEAFRGSWRIAGCSDWVTTEPPLSGGYSDLDMLVSVDYAQPAAVFLQGAVLPTCLGSVICSPPPVQ
jgi:hypothetical protein